jgi:CO/xanthine dehydrogenase Mo-binding subunit
LRNLPAKGEAFIPNDTPSDGDWATALRSAANALGWGQPLGKHRGRGISLGLKSSSTASASLAIVRLHYDGSASVMSGTSDMGQGARTVLAQIAAQELSIHPDRVAMVMGDTAVVPYDSSTSASRSTVFMGNAIVKACADVKQRLRKIAAETFHVDEKAVDVSNGRVRLSDRDLSYADLLKAGFGPPRGEVIGIGEERGGGFVPEHPLGGRPEFWEFMCTAAEVEVDPEVGMVEIVKLVLASDIGKALNPQQVEAQDEGAAVMGLGHSLMEHLLLDEHGRILNLGALDYRIPTVQDVPHQLQSILIENADGPGPYGAKGAGEGGILAIAAAVGAAINQAAGVEIRDLPLTPERIWRAIVEKATPAPEDQSRLVADV